MSQARTACDAWKREAAMANKKAEVAAKEKEMAIAKCSSLQKEVSDMTAAFNLNSQLNLSFFLRLSRCVWSR